jgi:hypothetical protein
VRVRKRRRTSGKILRLIRIRLGKGFYENLVKVVKPKRLNIGATIEQRATPTRDESPKQHTGAAFFGGLIDLCACPTSQNALPITVMIGISLMVSSLFEPGGFCSHHGAPPTKTHFP